MPCLPLLDKTEGWTAVGLGGCVAKAHPKRFVVPDTLLVRQNHVEYLVRFSLHLSEGFTPSSLSLVLLGSFITRRSSLDLLSMFPMIQKWLLHGDAGLALLMFYLHFLSAYSCAPSWPTTTPGLRRPAWSSFLSSVIIVYVLSFRQTLGKIN